MLPLNHYTISGLESLRRFPTMEVAQFTENGRIWPGKRRTVDALRSVRPYHTSKVLVHADFIYILSRFAMFSDATQQAIVKELVDIMDYAKFDKTIIGIVMHTDWSLKKGISDSTSRDKVEAEYQGTVWKTKDIHGMVQANYFNWLEYNIDCFVKALLNIVPPNWKPGCKIYLENTTKVGPNKEGSFSSLWSLLAQHLDWQSYFGLTLDSEHMFAIDGVYPDFVKTNQALMGIDMVAHLNTIPSDVQPCSGRDRHSETTIFECSKFTPDDYMKIVADLKAAGIPFVREVKEDTMFREMNQLEQWLKK